MQSSWAQQEIVLTNTAIVWVLVLASSNSIQPVGTFEKRDVCRQAVTEVSVQSGDGKSIRALCVPVEKPLHLEPGS